MEYLWGFFRILRNTLKKSNRNILENKIDELITKFLHNELNHEEALRLKEWLKFDENRTSLAEDIRIHHLINASSDSFDAEKAFQTQFAYPQITDRTIRPVRKLWFKYAAAAVVLAMLAFWMYFGKNWINGTDETITAKTEIIEPGTDKATLTLANGEKVVLNGAYGVIALGSGAVALNDSTGVINYQNRTDLAVSFNTLEVPRGGTYQIILSDGTKVWLNAASKLRYAVGYQVGERTVDLEGEAYFEVKRDAGRPFKIKTKGQDIEVLGTHFNVNSYDEEPFVKTTLLEGAVKISSGKNTVFLKPGQESINRNGILSVNKVKDVGEAISWKNGKFQFEDEDLESVIRKIARWYDIDVKFVGKTANRKFNGIISRSKSLEKALKIIEATENVSFKIEGRTLIVKI